MNPKDTRKAYLVVQCNIISVFSLSVKKILENSCFQETLDDYSEEVSNFLTILEHILYFCNKATRKMFSHKVSPHPWKLFQQNCKEIPNSCIYVILQLENLNTNFARIRALLKLALIEKRLHLYISAAFRDDTLNRKFYEQDSIVLSPQFQDIINQMVGLTAVDFSFDLRLDINHPGFNPIDFSTFLKYYQSAESVLDDLKECHSAETDYHYCSWKERYELMFEKSKKESKQKGYLEEVLYNKETQLVAALKRNKIIDNELKLMENSVTDLQVQLALLHEQYNSELVRLGARPELRLTVPCTSTALCGSRADLTSKRHRLTAQMSEIERSITKGTDHKLDKIDQLDFVRAPTSASIVSIATTAIASDGATADEDGSTEKNKSEVSVSDKIEIKTQIMTNDTKHYFSPSNNPSRRCSMDASSAAIIQAFSGISDTSNLNGRINNLLHNNQNEKIMESQRLRKMMVKANRSPLIKAHRHSVYLSSLEPHSFENYENYTVDDLESGFNCSNVQGQKGTGPSHKGKLSRNKVHSPSNPESYYQISNANVSEELIDDNYFDVPSDRVHPTMVTSMTTDASTLTRDVLVSSPLSASAPSISSPVQLMQPPEIIHLPPLITAEVPQQIEPATSSFQLPYSHHLQNSRSNGDRNSPNNASNRN